MGIWSLKKVGSDTFWSKLINAYLSGLENADFVLKQ